MRETWYSNCNPRPLVHVLLVITASCKWERVGKGGKPANKCTGQQKSHKNTKDNDKPLDASQLELTGMII